MFGDIQSENEDDFAMPPYTEENPAAEDTPEQAEGDDDKIDAFDEGNTQIIIPNKEED